MKKITKTEHKERDGGWKVRIEREQEINERGREENKERRKEWMMLSEGMEENIRTEVVSGEIGGVVSGNRRNCTRK